jgi:hypothetical protein
VDVPTITRTSDSAATNWLAGVGMGEIRTDRNLSMKVYISDNFTCTFPFWWTTDTWSETMKTSTNVAGVSLSTIYKKTIIFQIKPGNRRCQDFDYVRLSTFSNDGTHSYCICGNRAHSHYNTLSWTLEQRRPKYDFIDSLRKLNFKV